MSSHQAKSAARRRRAARDLPADAELPMGRPGWQCPACEGRERWKHKTGYRCTACQPKQGRGRPRKPAE